MKTRRWLVAGVFFGGLWVFVGGSKLSPRPLLANFLVGLAVGLPIAYIFRRLYEEEIEIARPFTSIPYVVLYAVVFMREVVVANFDVAYRVLAPRMRLEPQVILVPLRVETQLGITTIANSITLTPGTVTLDHDPDENALYVHAIDGRDPEAIVEPIRTWENYALVIFDEERSLEHPPPEITVHPPDYPPEPKTTAEHLDGISDSDSEEADGEPDTGGETDGQ